MLEYDFFYGNERDQFSFFRIPRDLIKNPKFEKLSTDAKLLYGLLLDRMSLSRKNGWLDEENRVYIIFTLKEVMEQLNRSHTTCSKLFQELEKYSLITKKVRGLGKPAIIYLHNIFRCNENQSTDRGSDSKPLDFQNVALQTSNFLQSRVQDSCSQDFQNLAPNYIDYNYTDLNYTEGSYTECCCSCYIPDIQEIKKYINDNNYTFDAKYFYDYYNARNWCLGNVHIDNFEALKSLMNNWELRERKKRKKEREKDVVVNASTNIQPPKGVFNNYSRQKTYSEEEINEILKQKQGSSNHDVSSEIMAKYPNMFPD